MENKVFNKQNKYGVKPSVTLVTHTDNVLETIYCLWYKSKESTFNLTPSEVKAISKKDSVFEEDVVNTFRKVIAQQIPVAENVWFTFMLHNDPISHREQMVRHRIGVHFGDNFGVDIIPDQQKSSFWSQSMRIMDYSKFVGDNKFFVPDSIDEAGDYALEIYIETLKSIEAGYTALVNHGIPMEDARNLLPLGTTMDISWSINLAGLLHVIGKSSCWILQYGLWGHIIKGMVKELVKIHPIFAEMSLPPCFDKGEFSHCKFELENERREIGDDTLPICPLYFTHNLSLPAQKKYEQFLDGEHYTKELMDKLLVKYHELWDRNVWTGKRFK